MRATRLVYAENDPALLGIVSTLLREHANIELLMSVATPDDALADAAAVRLADAALLDLALGNDRMNGIDLGLALRSINPDIGIVIHSQHSLAQIERRIPERQRMGWSTVPKTGDMSIESLVDVIRLTARGMSQRVPQDATDDSSALAPMTARQRAVMSLAASGVSTQEIARRLGISHDAVRQDLSKCYRLLAPKAGPTDDSRTLGLRQGSPDSGPPS